MRKIAIVAVAWVLLCGVSIGAAEVNVSVGVNTGDFAFLADFGNWVDLPTYGRCWRPSVVVGWHPFHYGHWTWTDQGWTWVSYEPYGWAVYHYGNWHYAPVAGWVWIPGYEWSAARVRWVWYGGHVAWAPLPPRGVVLPDPWVVPKTRFWNVVEIKNFTHENVGELVIRTNLVRPAATVRIVRTAPAVVEVERVTGRKIEVVRVNKVDVAVGSRKLARIEFPPPVAHRVNVHRVRVEKEVILKGKKGEVHATKKTTVKVKKKKP